MANLYKIRELLEKKRITIVELSQEIKMTPQGITSAIKRNKITSDSLELIAKFLDVPVGYFFVDNEATGSTVHHGNYNNITGKGDITVSIGEQVCRKELDKVKHELDGAKSKIIELQDKILKIKN